MTKFERAEVEFAAGWIAVGAMQGKTGPFDRFFGTPGVRPEPCRDRFEIAIIPGQGAQLIAFAVADGISSESHSEYGAQCAVDAAIGGLRNACRQGVPNRAGFEQIFEDVHRTLDELARNWNYPLKSLGTTLVAGVLDTRDGTLACASIGDGFIVADNGTELWWFPSTYVFEPSGSTYSITYRDWRKVMSYQQCPFRTATAAAFTDGLQHIMFEVDRTDLKQVVRTPHRKAVEALKAAVLQAGNVSRTRNLATLLGMRENEKLMADDRTIVVIQRLVGSDIAVREHAPDGTLPAARASEPTPGDPRNGAAASTSVSPVEGNERVVQGLQTLTQASVGVREELKSTRAPPRWGARGVEVDTRQQ